MTTYARTFKLTFEMPKPDQDTVIRAEVHLVTENEQGEITFTTGTKAEIFRLLSDIYADTVTIEDPMTQQIHVLSVAAIARAVTQIVVGWMPDEIPGTVDESGRYIVEE